MERKEKIYEGKSKVVFGTNEKDKVIIHFKDEATAGDGAKKGIISGKGKINCEFSSIVFSLLAEKGIKTHFIKRLSPTEMLCYKVKIVPVEVIVRNIAAGSLAKRMGIEEGTELKKTILEHNYKKDELHDPMVNFWHILEFGWATKKQYDEMNRIAMKVNKILKPFFEKRGVLLVDYKLEFGEKNGELLLADEITPDGCRFWDKDTKKKLDKDRFRRDLGGIEEAYQEILARIKKP